MKRKYILFFVLLLPLAMNGAGIGINGICYNLNVKGRTAEVTKSGANVGSPAIPRMSNNNSTSLLSCPDDHHPHMIDLGLPSGTKWACCNVGATTPEEYGDYYAWGETEMKNEYTWNNYIHCNGSSSTCHDLGDIIGTVYDIAHIKWQGNWFMPSLEQGEELISNCTSNWTTINGINGCLVTGKNGSQIFLPANGYRKNTDNSLTERYSLLWLSVPSSDEGSYRLVAGTNNPLQKGTIYKYYGQGVRPVVTDNPYLPLMLSNKNIEIALGEDATIEITSGNGNYTVTSSNQNVASATITGSSVIIHAIDAGTTTIIVTDTKTGDQVAIEVTVIVHLQLSESSVNITKGKIATINITSGNSSYTVTSSNTSVATATIEGSSVKIVSVGAGTATITITDITSGETVAISVTVSSSFSVSENTLSMMIDDENVIVRLTGNNGSYNISSSNVNVATATFEQLEDGGNITIHAVGAGTATITVTDTQTGETATIEVTVSLPLELAKTALRLYLNYNREWVRISSGNGSYTVTSSNENVATAMIDGSSVKVTAIARGTATITVTDTQTGLTANIAVTVVDHSNDPLTPSSPLPSNGAVDVGTSGTFAWLIPAFNGGKGTHFELYLDTDSRFRNTNEQPYQTDEGNSCGFSGLKPGTKYYWKVKVYNEKGQYTISDTWSFTTREKKSITNALLGDVNDDNLISVTDVMMMVNYVLGQPTNGFNASKADINDDNSIGVSDIMMVVDIILNSTESGDPYLVIWHKDGSKVQFKLTEKPQITYLGEIVSIKASSTVEYEFQAIRKMTFERHARKLLTPMKPFTIEGEAVTFLPADKDLHVKAALTNGEIVKDFVVRKGETATLPLESRPANDYVINVNGVTYKIKTK